MPHQQFQSCIQACYNCAIACNHCAASCLQEPHVQAMVRCIALDMDCAQVCELTAALMSRGSPASLAICLACAEICEDCGAECAQHPIDHCQQCAQACRQCAEECRRMVATL